MALHLSVAQKVTYFSIGFSGANALSSCRDNTKFQMKRKGMASTVLKVCRCHLDKCQKNPHFEAKPIIGLNFQKSNVS